MSKGGGQSSGPTTTVTKQEIDPQIKAELLGNLEYAKGVSSGLAPRQFAGYTPTYRQGEGLTRQTALGGAGLGTMQQAADVTGQVAGFTPQQISADPSAIQSYMNPYTQNVVDLGLSDLERSRQMATDITGAQATAAGAFGGSRHGLQEAATNEAFARQAAQMAGGLRQQGYGQALGAAQQQQQLNQMAGLQGAQLRGQAAGQLGEIGQQQQLQGYMGGEALQNLGLSRQAFGQQQLDAARDLERERLGIRSGALGMLPTPMSSTQNSSGSSTSRDIGLFDIATLGASIYGKSDKRLKSCIKRIGEIAGINIYSWVWNDKAKEIGCVDQPTTGVIAQEVMVTHPEAVVKEADGFYAVNYGMLGV